MPQVLDSGGIPTLMNILHHNTNGLQNRILLALHALEAPYARSIQRKVNNATTILNIFFNNGFIIKCSKISYISFYQLIIRISICFQFIMLLVCKFEY